MHAVLVDTTSMVVLKIKGRFVTGREFKLHAVYLWMDFWDLKGLEQITSSFLRYLRDYLDYLEVPI